MVLVPVLSAHERILTLQYPDNVTGFTRQPGKANFLESLKEILCLSQQHGSDSSATISLLRPQSCQNSRLRESSFPLSNQAIRAITVWCVSRISAAPC